MLRSKENRSTNVTACAEYETLPSLYRHSTQKTWPVVTIFCRHIATPLRTMNILSHQSPGTNIFSCGG